MIYHRSMSDRRAMEESRCFVRNNIVQFILERVPSPSPSLIMAKHKAVFDKRVSLPCHVNRRGNMHVAYIKNANGRKIDKFHKCHAVA